jgi:hypothetical protein
MVFNYSFGISSGADVDVKEYSWSFNGPGDGRMRGELVEAP